MAAAVHLLEILVVIDLPESLYFLLQCLLMGIFENLVLSQSGNPLLEGTIINVENQPLMV